MNRIKLTAAALALAFTGIGVTAATASAAPSCDGASHGAPGGFGPNSPYYTIPAGQDGIGGHYFGQAQGRITGENNSAAAAACNAG